MIQTRAKYIVTDNANAARALEAVKDLDAVKEIFVIGEHVGCTSVSQLMQEEDLSDSTAMDLSGSSQIFDTESLAWLTYSSGTTGAPKAIVHPHKSISKLATCYRCVSKKKNCFNETKIKKK